MLESEQLGHGVRITLALVVEYVAVRILVE